MQQATVRALVEERWPATHVATTEALAAAGITDRTLTAAVRAKCVHRVRRGAYVLGKVWNQAKPWERAMLQLDAHAASRTIPAVYSHVSAARLLGCSVWDAGERIHISVPYASSATSHGADVAAHRVPVSDEDLVTVVRSGRLLRLTALERTVADCARVLDVERAAVIGDHALRMGATVKGIAAAAERSGLVRGARRVERLLEALDGRSESAGETRTRLALKAGGVPELQFEVMTEAGNFRADFAWPSPKVILEFDGDAKYVDYAPTAAVLMAERMRENALTAAGWVIVRTRWAELATPEVIVAKVMTAFARAARLAG
ncbi:hypothetical protein [Sinomonas halotolerans]|uniref:Transcriptional regulator, AbiEi antitoxin, Type IV TA system n=1 Tax=Sinomonas halotolerans TaxID=1644133 RepID=A0ABU9WY73_9MICC